MSQFSFTDLHDSLPLEFQLSSNLHNSAIKHEPMSDGSMPLDDQPPAGRPPELVDHGVHQDFSSDNSMPLNCEAPLDQLLELPDTSAPQGIATDTAMDIDVQPPAEQPSGLYGDGNAQDLKFDEDAHARDFDYCMNDPQGWWVYHGGTLHSDGSIDFGPSANDPILDFEMDDITPPIDSTTQAPFAEPKNPFGLCGLPTSLVITPTSEQSQQAFAQPESGPNQDSQTPTAHSLPYAFDWDDIAKRQSRVKAGNRCSQFFTNSGTGTVLEAIPEKYDRTPGMSFPPVQLPSSVANLDLAARTLTTPSSSPTLRAATLNNQSIARRHTVAIGRNQPTGRNHTAVKFPIYTQSLLVNGLSEAKTMTSSRIALDVIDDDRDLVAAQAQLWVPLISQAFDSDFLLQPDDGTRLTNLGQLEWTRWQTEHENKVWNILEKHPEPSKFVQSCAFIFYALVLEAHEHGKGLPNVGKAISNPGPNISLKCSERINEAIEVLKNFPIVRYDFLRQDRLDGLAANPLGFVNRKIENMWVNYKKKAGTGPVKVEQIKAEPTTDATKGKVAGKKRGLAEMEQQLDANGLPTGNTTTQPGRKRAKATPKKRASQVVAPKSEAAVPMEGETRADVKDEDEIM